ncbi:hypothetical protein JL101_036095 (plasmid) [Skermanella rosea]|uniref:hypothetical protein n=1 Tax=Skermanella rosea TaxID=1817965 RepID=UPI0019349AB6|nr:hypothetical protein [Skermanella rosea]UEM08179.1 hypothetical protein JL101_036095 [Skermanella rosea]
MPDKFEPVWVDSLKVAAQGTSGQTAHRVIEIDAGPDRVFEPQSIRFEEHSRSGGGAIWHKFLKDQYVMVDVPTIVAGREYIIKMPRKIKIELHAETGSGPGNYNRGAWLNGYVQAETLEYDR